MHERQQRDARRVAPERSRPHRDGRKSMSLEQLLLVVGPPAFRPDCEQHVRRGDGGHDLRRVVRAGGVRTQPQARWGAQLVLDEHLELPVNAHDRDARVPSLLQAFEQQRAIDVWLEHMRVEVVPFNSSRIGEPDAADTEGGKLSPQTLEDLGTRQRQQQVYPRTGRWIGLEGALEVDAAVLRMHEATLAEWSIHDPHTDGCARRRLQNGDDMRGTHAGEPHGAGVGHLMRLEQDDVHVNSEYPSGSASISTRRPFRMRKGTAGTTSQPVLMAGDGLALTPAEQAARLSRALDRRRVLPDAYATGGVVEELEETFARILGKAHAVFMPTGTLANHLAIRALAQGHGRVAVQEQSHIYQDSGDAVQALSGLPLVPLGVGTADFTAEDLQRLIDVTRTGRVASRVSVVSIETPVRRHAGRAVDDRELPRIVSLAREHDIALHLDGARLLLQAAYMPRSVASFAKPFDTVYVSLYKYLNAPSGAILAGPQRLMAGLRDVRRRFGGGVYQAWPSALLALDALDGFPARFARAVVASERCFARLTAAGIAVERVSNGTNRSTLRLPAPPAEVRRALRRHGVELPEVGRDGRVTVTVNETWLRRSPRELADAIVARATPNSNRRG